MENSTANNLRSLYAQRKATQVALEAQRSNVIRQLGLDLLESGTEMSTVEIAAKYGLPVNGICALLCHFGFRKNPTSWRDVVVFRRHNKTISLYYRMTDASGNPFGPVQTIEKKVCTWSAELR